MAFAFGFVAIVFLSFGIEKLWTKYLNLKILKLFLLPGTIVHDLSHALLCIITGTTIKELNIFKLENGGGIKYDRPKIPILLDFFIASSPIFGCACILIFVSIILGNPLQVKGSLPNEVSFSVKAVFDHAKNFLDMIWLTLNEFWRHGFRISSIIFIIVSIVFTVSMAPHKGDIKYIVLGFIILGFILFVLEWLGVSLQGYKWWADMLDGSWRVITYIVSVLLTILFISSIIIGIIKAVKLTLGYKDG